MKYTILILLVSLISISCFYQPKNSNNILNDIKLNRGYKKVEESVDLVGDIKHATGEAPNQWLWNDIDGINFLTNVQTQNQPQYCGSSWALSTTSALNDRIKIMRKAAWPEIYLAPQVLLSCSFSDFGCLGGDPLSAYKYIQQNSISDSTCTVYQGQGYNNGLTCNDYLKCGNCWNSKDGCFPIYDYQEYTISGYGQASGEEKMKTEIYDRGPITCTISNTLELEKYDGGIFKDTTGATEPNHVVSVVGYGEENGEKYWLVRNTIGEYWGEHGYFRIVRGENNLGIEDNCSFGVVRNTWGSKFLDQMTQTKLILEDDTQEEIKFNISEEGVLELDQIEIMLQKLKEQDKEEEEEPKKSCAFSIENGEDLIKSPLPHTYIKEEDLPKGFDWRNQSGTNYASWSVNQHIPVYCGSCWSQATTSAFADRTNIARENKFPGAAFAAQNLINCNHGGTCNGGSISTASKDLHDYGCPLYTCQVYQAKNPALYECSDYQQCYNCFDTEHGEVCLPVEPVKGKIPKVYATEYGRVSTVANEIRAEIMARGPIMCNIESTALFHKYVGGVYKEKITTTATNHVISLLGWGESDDGIKYWIGRNSWGTYWGESGYFKISTDNSLNLNVTKECYFMVPDVSDF